MLTHGQFDILYYLSKKDYLNQRAIQNELHYSLGKINSLLADCLKNGWLDNTYKPTPSGFEALSPYKVDNAIIMAAGMSSRFVPLSLEKPKGLLVVKNEVLIERQIEQLKEAGIDNITIVLGYKKEAFFYLEEKYNVKIIINPFYNIKNNIETLFLAQNELSNTYICSSDDYFSKNVFEDYVYQSYYSSVHVHEKTNEWYMIPDSKMNCKKVVKSGNDGYIMLGHVYWNREFSRAFIQLINDHHYLGDYDSNLWEDLFADNIKNLPPMEIRVFDESVIHEFDSLDELRQFDEYYIHDSHSKILKNICKTLGCQEIEILNFRPIKEGLTNTSFIFEVNGEKFVYRHPGEGTELLINRAHEKQVLITAKEIGADPTFIAMDEKEGWKISHYVGNIQTPDYKSFEDSKRIISILKKLHAQKITVDWDFLPWEEACKLEDVLRLNSGISLPDFDELKSNVKHCYEITMGDGVEKCLCHCDTYGPNWMLTNNQTILIDWEYAGMADPGCDVGGYIMDAMYEIDDAIKFIAEYIGGPDEALMNHYLAYVAIISYYWFVWALYRESCGGVMGDSLHNWYVMAKRYSNYLSNIE